MEQRFTWASALVPVLGWPNSQQLILRRILAQTSSSRSAPASPPGSPVRPYTQFPSNTTDEALKEQRRKTLAALNQLWPHALLQRGAHGEQLGSPVPSAAPGPGSPQAAVAATAARGQGPPEAARTPSASLVLGSLQPAEPHPLWDVPEPEWAGGREREGQSKEQRRGEGEVKERR
ncbi:Hypothetical predicted protein [Xyrichtys novacula]|uniref:Uncharacterized protein n=1 Tax=Xyrichtys novacula TaxID=13765 RepID=A0AAV1FWW3_XYRNO|nr:Hypothetical predicted protein [Xyrichtys novacula]